MNIKPLLVLFILNILFSFFYALWYWEGMRVLKDNFMIFNTFNFSRIHSLRPILWYIMFAFSLWIIWKSFRFPIGKRIVLVLIITQCSIFFNQSEDLKYG